MRTLIFLSMMLWSLSVFADDTNKQLYNTLFSEIDSLYAVTQKEQVRVLAPDTYDAGYKSYISAQKDFKKGKKLSSIKKKISKARAKFESALDISKKGKSVFATTLKARKDAENVGSAKFAPALWKVAEDLFRTASNDFQVYPNSDYKNDSNEAEEKYRQAELKAIKGNALNETRRLLAKAKTLKVKKYAPLTLKKAQGLLQKAEQSLNQNRYDLDEPRNLVRQAQYEANHAIYLAEIVRNVRRDKTSVEQVILNYEKPLVEIAGTANIVAKLDDGYTGTTNQIIEKIEQSDAQNNQLNQDIQDLQFSMNKMQKELGSLSNERVGLKRLEKQRKQVERIERMFTRDEALVLRKGQSIILRLTGLTFEVNKSDIKAGDVSLLGKVQQAVNVFSGSRLNVEGHTDSFGSDSFNLNLSRQRANSVKDYMLANLSLKNASLGATGYGESKPVANNETEQGRRKNRRIDIVITPQ